MTSARWRTLVSQSLGHAPISTTVQQPEEAQRPSAALTRDVHDTLWAGEGGGRGRGERVPARQTRPPQSPLPSHPARPFGPGRTSRKDRPRKPGRYLHLLARFGCDPVLPGDLGKLKDILCLPHPKAKGGTEVKPRTGLSPPPAGERLASGWPAHPRTPWGTQRTCGARDADS